jgi:hypothetical protein
MTDFDAMLTSLRAVEDLAEETARRAAPRIEASLRVTAAAGRAPDGTPWPARKDGGRPLTHAADHITAKAIGHVVRATLTGPDVWHHFGGGRNPRRQVLPDPGTVPPNVRKALDEAAAEAFGQLVK